MGAWWCLFRSRWDTVYLPKHFRALPSSAQAAVVALVLLLCGAHAVGQQDETADPGNILGKAITLLRAGQARQALETLEPVETLEPNNPWLWFYKGSAYMQLREPYKALENYDRALEVLGERGDADQELADTVSRHRRLARQQVVGFSLRMGLAYDTNVTFLAGGVTGPGLIAGRGDGVFRSDFRLDYAPIANQEETVTVGARLGHSWHFGVEQFNFQDYGGYVRYARILDNHWEAALQYDYDMTYLGNDSFLSNHAVTSSLTYTWQPNAAQFRLDRTSFYYVFENRDFLFETTPEFDSDGVVNAVGVQQSFQIRPINEVAWTCDLSLGYRFSFVDTEGLEFDRLTHDWYLGLEIPPVNPGKPDEYLIIPDRELTFRFGAYWQLDDYRHDSLIDRDGDERSDLITILTFGVSQKLIENDGHGDWTVHGLISWTDSDSNITQRDGVSPFTYDRVVYGALLEWTW